MTPRERWARLTRAYGEDWAAGVEALPGSSRLIAVDAAGARYDQVAEDVWMAATAGQSHARTDSRLPHVDAGNSVYQTVLVLKDRGLWPWQRVPRPIEADDDEG